MNDNKIDHEVINILDLRDSPWMDGPGRTILETAALIDKTRFRIFIGAFSSRGSSDDDYVNEARKRALEVVIIEENKSIDFGVLGQINRFIKQNNIHIIHTHEFRSNLYGLLCAKQTSLPIIVTLHGYIANNLKAKVYRFMDKLLVRFFDEITTVSKRLQAQLVKSFILRKRITVINNALIVDRYEVDREGSTLKDELGVPEDSVLIVSIGRLSPEKGQDNFLRAARTILDKYSNAVFILVGIGPDEASLKSLVKNLGIEANVQFLGFRKDMQNIYNGVDLVVQSSYTEGMPNVILEALIMEVPAIATDVGGTGEIIENYVNGVLIEPNSITDISEKILEYYSQRDQYKAMAVRGRQDVIKKFSFAKRTCQQMDIYQNMVNKRLQAKGS